MNLVVKLAMIGMCPRMPLVKQLQNCYRRLTYNTVPLRLLCQVFHNIFFAIWHRLPIKLYVICAVVRVLLASFTGRQIQYLSPPARQVYEAWLEKKMNRSANHAIRRRLSKSIRPLPVGGDSAILWLGDRHAARKVVLFFPGGGYVAGLMPCHLELCWNAYVCTGIKENVEVAVAVLQYTLSPTGQYPVHLRQAASALSKLFEAGFRPRDIIIGGESAGGNLTMQLLGHLLHPHPDAQHIKSEEPLAGAFLVSPWLSSDVSSRFFRENGKIDMLSAGIVQKLSIEALGVGGLESCAAGENPWVAPLDVDESWLRVLTIS